MTFTIEHLKTSLEIERDDRDNLLWSMALTAATVAEQYVGTRWQGIKRYEDTLLTAIPLYVREMYDGDPSSLVTTADKMHPFYRMLKVYSFSSPTEEELENLVDNPALQVLSVPPIITIPFTTVVPSIPHEDPAYLAWSDGTVASEANALTAEPTDQSKITVPAYNQPTGYLIYYYPADLDYPVAAYLTGNQVNQITNWAARREIQELTLGGKNYRAIYHIAEQNATLLGNGNFDWTFQFNQE